MRIIEPGYKIISYDDAVQTYTKIENAARTCYKSANQGVRDPETGAISENDLTNLVSTSKLVSNLIKNSHEAMLEHATMTVLFVVDRGISHEIVRHRMASFAQESTRYCNYSQDKFGKEITVIKPFYLEQDTKDYSVWYWAMKECEHAYFTLLQMGYSPEKARCVLPTSLKTELVMTANMREWRHFFKLRAAGETGKPHPQMLEVAVPLLKECQQKFPILFSDIVPMEEVK